MAHLPSENEFFWPESCPEVGDYHDVANLVDGKAKLSDSELYLSPFLHQLVDKYQRKKSSIVANFLVMISHV